MSSQWTRFYLAFAAAILCACLVPAGTGQEAPLDGYSPTDSKTQRDWEAKFRAIPDPKILRSTMERLAARPHNVGTPYDKDNAEWILLKFKEWGWDAQIEKFDVLYPTPKRRLVELTAPSRFTAKLEEPNVAVDPTSSQKSEQLPTYNVYTIDGDVTAPLVYVNYGAPDDYDELERMGVSVKGAIVIARYGRVWRGIKPKLAADHGAVGCLIYSDPRDDGYFVNNVFPTGPMRRPKECSAAVSRISPRVFRATRCGSTAAILPPRDTPRRTRRASRRSRCCPSPTETRSPCSPLSPDPWPRRRGGAPCPFPIT